MVEGRPRQHEPVDERGGQARPRAAGEGPHGARGGRPVDVDDVPHARVERRDHEGLALGVGEPEVAHERLVEDRVDRGAVVVPALRRAPQTGPGGGGGGGHGATLRPQAVPWEGPIEVGSTGPMDLHVVLAHGAGTGPLRDQLEEHVRRGVRDGRLRPGAALPPTRALARRARRLARGGGRGVRPARGRGVPPRPPRRRHGRGPAAAGRTRAGRACPRGGRRAPRRRRRPTTCARAVPTSRRSRARRGRRRSGGRCGRSPTPASTTATRAAPRRCERRWRATSGAPGASPPGRATSSSPRASPRGSRSCGRRCASAAPGASPSRTRGGAASAARSSTPGWRPCRCPSTPTGSTSTPFSRWTRPSTPSP